MGQMKKLDLDIMTALRGAGGGADEPRDPIEAPDSLHSIAYARILDLVSEGEIYGFADQDNPLSCVFLNETPVANADGSLNFKNIQIDSRVGTQSQDYLPDFDGVENEIAVGVELRQETPWTRSLSNLNLNAVRVRISTPALSKSNTSNGDINGYRIYYRIELQTDDGAFVSKLNSSFNGKTTTKYERSHRIELPPATTGWTLRVVRLTANATTAAIQDMTVIDSYTEIVEAKLRMPMSALVSTIVDAEQFNNIPSRAYRLRGRIIRVPSNYDPVTRTYTGAWDGTFQSRYSDNPAWVFYDMALNTRYGLGHLVPNELVNKWFLYRIAQYCDGLVDDGMGGQEPRFTCNLYLQTQNDALRVMQDLATVFRGVVYASGGAVAAVSDMPEDSTYTYTPVNVIDGKFTYSGSSRKVRHTVALVSWNDMADFGRAKVEYVEDREGINRYGIQETEVIALGCTSRGQARRWGRYILATERYETDSVVFGVGLDGTVVAPGKIFSIADPLRAGQRRGGRIRSATSNSVTVDLLSTPLEQGDTLIVTLPTAVSERRMVQSVNGNVITVVSNFSAVPVPQSVWAVESDDLALQTYRALAVEEMTDGTPGYTISAIQHVPGKFAYADSGMMIEEPPIAPVPESTVPSPTGLTVTARDVADQNTTVKVVNLSWNAVAVAVIYSVKWRQSDGNWVDLGRVGATNIDINGIRPGGFEVQVVAINSAGKQSLPTFGGPYDIPAVDIPPGYVEDLISGQEALEAIGLENQQAIAQEILDRQQTDAQLAVVRAQIGDIMQADEWEVDKTYPLGDLVQHNGRLVRSQIDDNAGHEPGTVTDAYWEVLGNYSSLGEAVAAHAAAITLHTGELDALTLTTQQQGAALEDKAESSALDAVENRVTDTEGELDAQGTRIGTLEARMPSGEDVLATAAALQFESARITQNAEGLVAQGSRLESVEARMPSGTGELNTAAAHNALEAEVLTQGGQVLANATAIDQVNVTLGEQSASITEIMQVAGSAFEGNGVINPGFEDGVSGWGGSAAGDGTGTLPAGVILATGGGAAVRSGDKSIYFSSTAGDIFNVGYTSVKAGQRVLLGFWARTGGTTNGTIVPTVQCYNAAGTRILYTGALGVSLPAGSNNVFTQVKLFYTPPAGTAFMRLGIRSNATAGNWIVDDAFLIPLSDTDTQFLTSYSLVLDVNGYITGYKFQSDGSTGILSIVADKFQIVSPGGGARTEFSNGNWRVYDANGVLRVRMGVW